MPNRCFGHIELITSNTIIIRIEECGRTRREEISRANPHIAHEDFNVGDEITFWSPRLLKGFIPRDQNQRERDVESKARWQANGYDATDLHCVFCSEPTMKKGLHEVCIRCGQSQIRE